MVSVGDNMTTKTPAFTGAITLLSRQAIQALLSNSMQSLSISFSLLGFDCAVQLDADIGYKLFGLATGSGFFGELEYLAEIGGYARTNTD